MWWGKALGPQRINNLPRLFASVSVHGYSSAGMAATALVWCISDALAHRGFLVPVWIFWSVTPALLVRGGGRAGCTVLAGLAGVVIDGTVLPLAARMFFPPLLSGWDEFGPIGVAMVEPDGL